MKRKVSEDIFLTPLKNSDALALYEAVEFSRTNLSKYMPWEKSVVDLTSAEVYIESRLNSRLEGSEWLSINFKNQFGGVFGIKSIDRSLKSCELGYWLADNARGNRVIGQVLDIVIPYLADEKNVRVIEFHCLESNVASVKLVKHAGAKLKRKIETTLDVPNQAQLMCIYALKVHA
ncbi:GNAT family N-acetyltransferase [Photobacterium makurazakiensis]|uniref:GNAT family N-acetyltransferase n=1 Tax=Photobacterium makurazakiensis TaxID=2910234 RepID=UPI003D0ABB65